MTFNLIFSLMQLSEMREAEGLIFIKSGGHKMVKQILKIWSVH